MSQKWHKRIVAIFETYIHSQINVYTYIHARIFIYIYIYTYVYVNINMFTCIYIYICLSLFEEAHMKHSGIWVTFLGLCKVVVADLQLRTHTGCPGRTI